MFATWCWWTLVELTWLCEHIRPKTFENHWFRNVLVAQKIVELLWPSHARQRILLSLSSCFWKCGIHAFLLHLSLRNTEKRLWEKLSHIISDLDPDPFTVKSAHTHTHMNSHINTVQAHLQFCHFMCPAQGYFNRTHSCCRIWIVRLGASLLLHTHTHSPHTLTQNKHTKYPHPPHPTTVLQLFLMWQKGGWAAELREWRRIACEDLIQCFNPRWVTSVARNQQIWPCQVYTLYMSKGKREKPVSSFFPPVCLFLSPATAYNY